VTVREQLVRVCQRNGDLACANLRLRAEVRRLEAERRELQEANANLRTERDATDVLFGAAMDQLVSGDRE
jgi:cell division protein FtsB